jgi:hypothetical protein
MKRQRKCNEKASEKNVRFGLNSFTSKIVAHLKCDWLKEIRIFIIYLLNGQV